MRVRPYVMTMVAAIGVLAPAGVAAAASGGGAVYHTAASSDPYVSHTTNISVSATDVASEITTITSAESGATVGGQVYGESNPSDKPLVEGDLAVILPDGRAAAPTLAPTSVKKVIWAANKIIGKPYAYGGGHKTVAKIAAAYDCSGAVSYALAGGKLLKKPKDSTDFMTWGAAGKGEWITVYTNPSHAYMEIAGIRLDTSAAGDLRNQKGPRWRPVLASSKGFKSRHLIGL